jgi:DNA-binding transcriptional MerR regulator
MKREGEMDTTGVCKALELSRVVLWALQKAGVVTPKKRKGDGGKWRNFYSQQDIEKIKAIKKAGVT